MSLIEYATENKIGEMNYEGRLIFDLSKKLLSDVAGVHNDFINLHHDSVEAHQMLCITMNVAINQLLNVLMDQVVHLNEEGVHVLFDEIIGNINEIKTASIQIKQEADRDP